MTRNVVSLGWAEAAMEYKDRCEQAEVEVSAIMHTVDDTTADSLQKVLNILRGKSE